MADQALELLTAFQLRKVDLEIATSAFLSLPRGEALDALWVVGNEGLEGLIENLIKKGLSLEELLSVFEPEQLPGSLSSEIWRKKKTQFRTKQIFNFPVYNLLRECSEGWSALFSDKIAPVKSIIGAFNLSPGRVGAFLIDYLAIYPDMEFSQISNILSSIGKDRLTSVAILRLSQSAVPSVARAIGYLAGSGLVDITKVAGSLRSEIDAIKDCRTRLRFDLSKGMKSVGRIGGEPSEVLDIVSSALQSASEYDGMLLPFLAGTIDGALSSSDKDESNRNVRFVIQFLNDVNNDNPQDPCLGFHPKIKDSLSLAVESVIEGRLPVELLEPILTHLGSFIDADALANLIDFLDQGSVLKNTFFAEYIFSALGQIPANPWLLDKTWNFLAKLSVSERYRIYSIIDHSELFPLPLMRGWVGSQVKNLLKRVVKEAQSSDLMAKNAAIAFAKLAASCASAALRPMVTSSLFPFNANLLAPYVEVTSRIGGIGVDVCTWILVSVLVEKPNDKGWLTETGGIEPWLNNLSVFTGKFFKKHPKADLSGILATISSFTKCSKESLFGRGLSRVILQALLSEMGGEILVEELNEHQISALAGGPILKRLTIVGGGVASDSRAQESLANALLTSTTNNQCITSQLLGGLITQRIQLTDPELENDMGKRIVGETFSGAHKCFVQLLSFLQGHKIPADFRPLANEIDQAAHHAILRTLSVPSLKSSNFWNMSFSDVVYPSESYLHAKNSLAEKIKSIDLAIDRGEGVRAAKREVARLRQIAENLESEKIAAEQRFTKELAKPSAEFLNNIVSAFLSSRVTFSVEDALFCATYCKSLLSAGNLEFSRFFTEITDLLAHVLQEGCEYESRAFGFFLNDLLNGINDRSKTEDMIATVFIKSLGINGEPNRDDNDLADNDEKTDDSMIAVESAEVSETTEPHERRNALVVLSRCLQSFPYNPDVIINLRKGLENFVQKEEGKDLNLLARGLLNKLAGRGVESIEPKPIEEPNQKARLGISDKNASTPITPPTPPKRAAETSEDDPNSKKPKKSEERPAPSLRSSGVIERPIRTQDRNRQPEPTRATYNRRDTRR